MNNGQMSLLTAMNILDHCKKINPSADTIFIVKTGTTLIKRFWALLSLMERKMFAKLLNGTTVRKELHAYESKMREVDPRKFRKGQFIKIILFFQEEYAGNIVIDKVLRMY
ncbi:hypothetical protein ACX0G7_10200 [Flavitalea antarctica]